MHLDEEQLQRLLHGESASAAGRSFREHLSGCADCRERLGQAERDEGEVHGLLRRLDHPAPLVRAEGVVARAVRARERGWGRWAAGALLALTAAGVAYAAPGSPLRGWARAVLEPVGQSPAPKPAAAPELAGLAMAPGRALTVVFRSAQPGGQVRVSLGDWTEVRVRAPVGAATFTSDAGRLVIENQSAAAIFEVEIPRDAPRVEIQVAGERIFLKDGTRLQAEGLGDMREPYTLPLLPSRR